MQNVLTMFTQIQGTLMLRHKLFSGKIQTHIKGFKIALMKWPVILTCLVYQLQFNINQPSCNKNLKVQNH
jgi:hypothetical protein